MVKEAVLPAVNLSFKRSVDEVSEVLMTPLELLFTDLTRVTFLAPDFPVTEQVALRALETVYDNFLFTAEAFGLNRNETVDFGFAILSASFNTGNL